MKKDLEKILTVVRKNGLDPKPIKNGVAVYFGDGCYAEVQTYKGTIDEKAALFLLWLCDESKEAVCPFYGLDGRIRVFNDTKRCLYSAMTSKSVVEKWKVFLWRRDNLYSVEFVEDYDYYIPFGFRVVDLYSDTTYDFPFAVAMQEEDLFSLAEYFNGNALNIVMDKIKVLNSKDIEKY